LKLEYDELVSSLALKFNLRRYTMEASAAEHAAAVDAANAAHADVLVTKVRRCRLTLSN